jgi:hypothetical protein
VSLRIAFDLDGVLADMEGELIQQAERLFGASVLRHPAPRPDLEPDTSADASAPYAPGLSKLHMSSRQTRRLWRHVQDIDGFWESLGEIEPGVVARLAALAAERRWEILFLTKRPESAGPTAQVQTQRWLASKGFPLPSVYVVQGSRGRIAASLDLDFVVDDRPENCLDVVVDSKARAILVWRDGENQLPAAARRLGIGVVKSVDECLTIFSEVDTPAPERPGMVDRVMRLLGLKDGDA